MTDITYCGGVYEFLDCYDGYIVDQWGVLHNGVTPYPNAIETLKQLREHKKQVIIISNSGKRTAYNIDLLEKMGFGPSLYRAVISAGEVTWQGLFAQEEKPFANLGKNCFLISKNKDTALIDGLNITVVDKPEEADFILLTGTDAPKTTLEDYEPLLKAGVAKGLPLICANPDMVTVQGNERYMGPGALAVRYREFGGVSHFVGKPHAPIFRHCQTLFQNVLPARTIIIGDSLTHDIAGGVALDIDTCFVTTGVHASSFKPDSTAKSIIKTTEQLAQNYGARPKWVMEGLRWMSPEMAEDYASARGRKRKQF